MKMANIKVIKPKKRHYYPNTGKLHKRADNLLDRDFNQQKSNTAVMERFFRSLKAERLNHQSFANHFEVVQNVESYIYFYNYKRIHSAIGYITPAQKMAELEKVA